MDYLVHHGVKGMKWGVRNEQKPIGRRPRRKQALTPEQQARKRKQQYRNQQLAKQKAMLDLDNRLGIKKHDEIKTKDAYLKKKMEQQRLEADLDNYLKGKRQTGEQYVNSLATQVYMKNIENQIRYPLVNAWLNG